MKKICLIVVVAGLLLTVAVPAVAYGPAMQTEIGPAIMTGTGGPLALYPGGIPTGTGRAGMAGYGASDPRSRAGAYDAEPNDPPVAVDDEFFDFWGSENFGCQSWNVLANDIDFDGDALSAELVSGTSHGWLSFQPDGSIKYMPDFPFTGTDTFSYRAYDGAAYSEPATVSIDIALSMYAPSCGGDFYTTLQDTPLIVEAPGVLANDMTFSPPEYVSVSLHEAPLHGVAEMAFDGSFTYTPDTGFLGTDTFRYCVMDVDFAFNFGTVSVTVMPVFIIVDPFGDAYIGDICTFNGTTSLPENTELAVCVNDSQPLTVVEGTALVVKGGGVENTWSFVLDTAGFCPDSYEVSVASAAYGIRNSTRFAVSARKGDLNENGAIDWGDVVKCAYICWQLVPDDPAADFNGSGAIDWGDVVRLAYYYWGKVSEL